MVLFLFKIIFLFILITFISSLFTLLRFFWRVKKGVKRPQSSAPMSSKGDIEAEYRVIHKE